LKTATYKYIKRFFSYKGGLLFEGGNTVFNSHVLQMLHPYLTKRKSSFGHIMIRLAVLLLKLVMIISPRKSPSFVTTELPYCWNLAET
jgi:hypothetical protein